MSNEACANLDYKYGPYGSVEEAFSSIPSAFRTIGLTVGVIENGVIQEYWFKSGKSRKEDLVPKLAEGNVTVEPNFTSGDLIATINGVEIFYSPNSSGGGEGGDDDTPSTPAEVNVIQGPITKSAQGIKTGTINGTDLYAPVITPKLTGGIVIGEFYKVNDQKTNLYAPNLTASLANNVYTVKYGDTSIFQIDKSSGIFRIGNDSFAFTKSSSNCLYYLSTETEDFISSPEDLGASTDITVTELPSSGIPVEGKKTLSVAIPCNYTVDRIDETRNNQVVTGSFQYRGILYYLGIPYQIYGITRPGNMNNNNYKFTFK